MCRRRIELSSSEMRLQLPSTRVQRRAPSAQHPRAQPHSPRAPWSPSVWAAGGVLPLFWGARRKGSSQRQLGCSPPCCAGLMLPHAWGAPGSRQMPGAHRGAGAPGYQMSTQPRHRGPAPSPLPHDGRRRPLSCSWGWGESFQEPVPPPALGLESGGEPAGPTWPRLEHGQSLPASSWAVASWAGAWPGEGSEPSPPSCTQA